MKAVLIAKSLQTACFLVLFWEHNLLRAQEGAVFQVKPLTGQSTIHVGERIPLQLSFSATVKDRFEINMAVVASGLQVTGNLTSW